MADTLAQAERIRNPQFPSSAVKAWVKANTVGGIISSFNVASLTDVGTGQLGVTWDTDFANGDYVAVGSAQIGSASSTKVLTVDHDVPPVAGSARFCVAGGTNNLLDPDFWHIMALGAQ